MTEKLHHHKEPRPTSPLDKFISLASVLAPLGLAWLSSHALRKITPIPGHEEPITPTNLSQIADTAERECAQRLIQAATLTNQSVWYEPVRIFSDPVTIHTSPEKITSRTNTVPDFVVAPPHCSPIKNPLECTYYDFTCLLPYEVPTHPRKQGQSAVMEDAGLTYNHITLTELRQASGQPQPLQALKNLFGL